MIRVFGRIVCVPDEEKEIGFTADNCIETRQFRITDRTLFPFSFKLELENGSHTDIIDLPANEEADALLLTWEIAARHLQFSGPLYAQLRAFSDSGVVWHSEVMTFSVKKSIEATETFPDVLPSEFTEMEKRMQKHLSETAIASAIADGHAGTAAEMAGEAERQASYATQFAQNAGDAANAAAQSALSAQENADYIRSVLTDTEDALTDAIALADAFIAGGDAS